MTSDRRISRPGLAAAWPRAALLARPWHEAGLAGLGVTVIALLPLLINDRFYFNDDYQSYFMPVFREISRLLMAGEFPLATPKIWFGGAIAGEYQYAVFHPVCLALYVILGAIDNLVVAATIYTLIHIFLLAGGVYVLCRKLGATALPAFIGALIGCTSSWLLYWGASNWIPALVSEAWMAWAIYFLLRAHDGPGFVPAAVAAVALTLLSGWPFTDLALLLAVAALSVIAVAARADANGIWRTGLALGLGALLAMPALLTAAGYLAESGREPEAPYVWAVSLNGIFSAGVPSAVDVWGFEGAVWVPSTAVQMLYASWLIPVALAIGGWRSLWRNQQWTLIAVVLLTGLFALCSMLPASWHFRWFFRLLPFYHAALGVLTALLLTHAPPVKGPGDMRYLLAFAAVIIPFIIPTSIDPRTYILSVTFCAAIAISLFVAFKLARRGAIPFHTALVAGHLAVLMLVVSFWPRSLQVPQWDYPALGPDTAMVARQGMPRRLALYDSELPEEPGLAYWSTIALGNTAAYLDAQTINGYSPPVQRGLARLFCFDFKGGVCAKNAIDRLFVPRHKNFNLLDLAGIEELAADSPERALRIARLAGDGWRIKTREGPYTVFGRTQSLPAGGDVLQPAGISITGTARSAHRTVFHVRAAADFQGGDVVIRRPWYPGVYARLNGRPLDVGTIERALPVVRLESGASGRLVVGYWPKGLGIGLVMAAIALLALAAAWRWQERLLTAPRWYHIIWQRFILLFARPSKDSSPE